MAMSVLTTTSSSIFAALLFVVSPTASSFLRFLLRPRLLLEEDRCEDDKGVPLLLLMDESLLDGLLSDDSSPLLLLLSEETMRFSLSAALLLHVSPSRIGRRHSKISWGSLLSLASAADRFLPFWVVVVAEAPSRDDVLLPTEVMDAVSSASSAPRLRIDDVTSHHSVLKSLRMRHTLQVGAIAWRRPAVQKRKKGACQLPLQNSGLTRSHTLFRRHVPSPLDDDSPSDEDEVSSLDSLDSR